MNLPRFKMCVISALVLALACVCSRAEDAVPVKMTELPAAVKKAIHEKAGKTKIDSIEKITDNGEVTYEIEIGRGGKAHDFTLDEDGGLVDEEISLSEAPPAIQAAIKKTAGAGSIEDITKAFDEGETSYDVDIMRDGKERSFTLDDKGKLIEAQVLPGELPAAVQKTVDKESAGGKLGDIYKEFDEDGNTYEIEINPDGKTRTLDIDEKGGIVSDEQEAALSETPEAVQKAIKELGKDGQLGGITKVIDEFGTNYDVDLKRKGKWDMVIVSEDGEVIQ